jgi:hypothetical protein
MAKMYSVTTNAIRIPYSFQCEKCGKYHARTCIKQGANDVGLSPTTAQRRALESFKKDIVKLKNAADKGDFSWISTDPCPDCGYIQSWQLKAHKSETRYIVLGLSLLLVVDMACISGLLLGTPKTLAWIIAAFLLICTGLLMRTFVLRNKRIGKTPRANQAFRPEVEWPNLH